MSRQIAAEVAVVDTIHLVEPFKEPERLGSGLAHCHFIHSAMQLNRPLLPWPAHYWAIEYAKWHSGERYGRDPYTEWYHTQRQEAEF